MLVELLYCSVSIVPELSNVDLNHILASARQRNLSEDITGMLLYYRGEFVQILEGKRSQLKTFMRNLSALTLDIRPSIKCVKTQFLIAALENGLWDLQVRQRSNHVCHHRLLEF